MLDCAVRLKSIDIEKIQITGTGNNRGEVMKLNKTVIPYYSGVTKVSGLPDIQSNMDRAIIRDS